MKKIFLLLFFTLFVPSLKAQIITFSDPLFKAKLLEASPNNFIARNLNGDYFSIDSNSNGEIEASEALMLGFLEIGNSSISSLNGIANFTNLVSLNCESNQLTALNVSNLSNLSLLNCSNNQLTSLNVNGLTEMQNLNCQFNQLTNLNANGITNLFHLDCSYNQIVTLDMSDLVSLEILNCSNNQIAVLDLADLITLKSFDCSYNQLLSINTSSLTSLESLNCNSNLIASLSIDTLINFNYLDCSNNQLTSLNLTSLSNLIDLNCNFNQLPLINLSDLTNLKNFNCTNNQLTALNLTGLVQLEDLYCGNNQIATIDLTGLAQLITLNCDSNQLTALDLTSLTNLKYLNCSYNAITSLNVAGLSTLLSISCSNNQIAALNLVNTIHLQSLYCSNNQLTTLNLSNLTSLQNLFCANNQLTSLFIKNGNFESNLQFSENPNLEYICADVSEVDFVQDEINNNNYTNCHVNSYCSFTPGGVFYTIQGSAKFDSNNNGCEPLDVSYPQFQLSFSDGMTTENLISDGSGNYSKSLLSTSYTLTPQLENPTYFSVYPVSTTVDFTQTTSPFNQNFCTTATGIHSDIEIAILPINTAIPGLDATYKIIYKNKGTISQSGSINLNFNDSVLDLILSNPAVSFQSSNNLNWAFANLLPLETRAILVTLNLNSTSETPSVTVGQLLSYTASVITDNTDETPNDNTNHLNQIVTNSTETNDKICVEGATISPSQVGNYVHYIIRFKNNGTAIAQNIVVKDVIDASKFDINTLFPIAGSHAFTTRISESNKVEFIFENINLSSNTLSNEGYVAFKIKTVPTLILGDSFTNSAIIYFDYKFPITTNTESTTIQALANQNFEFPDNFNVYPNPAKEVINIYSTNYQPGNAVRIYNTLGQLVQIITNPKNSSIDVSELKSGTYFINISTEKGIQSVKFLKE